jgi:hypothetical protein
MNSNRGIFDSFTKPAGDPAESPFRKAAEKESGDPPQATSPFAAASPFQVAEGPAETQPAAFGKPVKLPERRTMDSPFQAGEPPEGFGFEATPNTPSSAFEAVPSAGFPPLASTSPFAVESRQPAPAPAEATESPFRPWQESSAPAAASQAGDFLSDSSSIRQLELRAIFGVDRELNEEEILKRARSLQGIRHISRMGGREAAAIEGLRDLLPAIGLPGPLKLFAGNTPVEFIREGGVLLAVQTEGAFAPGVRETLMIVARELGRLG